MRKKLLLIFFMAFIFMQSNSQVDMEKGILFSEAIDRNIKNYIQNSQKAYYYGDFERVDFLFDSLVDHVVVGSYLDNFKVKQLSGRKIEFSKFEKPIFLITYSSWCTPGIGEIPALNEIAKNYHKQIDFVVLFWDSKKNARKASRKYSNKIKIVYVDELENSDNYIVNRIKHSLGLPISLLIAKNKRIIAVKRGAIHFYDKEYEDSFELNYNTFHRRATRVAGTAL